MLREHIVLEKPREVSKWVAILSATGLWRMWMYWMLRRQLELRVRKLRRTRADIWVLRRRLSAHHRPHPC